MSKKRIVRLTVLAAAAVLVLAALVFTRPMTLEQMYPDLDWDALDGLTVYARQSLGADTGTAGKVFDHYEYNATLSDGDELTQELVQLLRTQTFRRKLSSFLTHVSGTRYHNTEDGDFEWTLYFGGDNQLLWINSWYGIHSVAFSPEVDMYRVAVSDEFLTRVFSLIAAHVEPTIDYYSGG